PAVSWRRREDRRAAGFAIGCGDSAPLSRTWWCAVWAFLAVVLSFGCQALTVRYNFHGDWSALFYAGAIRPLPPAVEREHSYQIPNSYGWDGQFYHFVAHDPLLRNGRLD